MPPTHPVDRSRNASRGTTALILAIASLSCARGAPVSRAPAAPAPACTFVNPLAPGADPWVVRRDSVYYYVRSHDRRIWIARSTRLSEVFTAPARAVWSAPDTGWNRTNVWAPELHFLDGRWYIYYAAGRDGPPFTSQHAGVLQSADEDAFGRWADRGRIYTGDSAGTGTGDRWSIDMTVGRIAGRDYAVWSGWARRASTDKTPQQLYIAPLENPWTISVNRVLLSAPDAEWERGPELDLQEGPEFLQRGGTVLIVYSTRDSWRKEYALGQLRLRDTTADPLEPSSWTKSGPVFTGNAEVFGVGHASFVTTPDGAERWIVYHTKDAPAPGWRRSVRMQRFAWPDAGAPSFGNALLRSERIPLPRGECR
ncbi:MAG: glycoside hydrolase [Gemmatimonadetes bacterium]|nr:MAG: glycoside hydrolase [Gemmatimonadota bacterium]